MATPRAEQVGGVSHTQCFTCGAFCRSHAHHLLHLASSHPALLDTAPAGRLGLVFLYQASGKLFHCNICLYTSRDFTQVWQHLLKNHCVDLEQNKDQNPGTKPGLNQDPETKLKPDQDPGAGPGAGPADVEMKSDGGEEQEPVKPMETEDHENHENQSLQKNSSEPCVSPDTSCGLLLRSGSGPYRCSVCSWSHTLRSIAVNHAVRKHDSPRQLYDVPEPAAAEANPNEANPASTETNPTPAEEEEEMTNDKIRQELEATKFLRFSGYHVVCELCGWKAKVKRGTRGFAQAHLERFHDLKKSFECTICGQAFFMAYRLKDHMRLSHRPGKYRCLFCNFRSDNQSGFRRHSAKCNFKDQDEDQDQDQVRTRPEPEEERERTLRPKRRSSNRMVLDDDEDED